ncbi:hypothetical protein [Bacillus sp. FJAT-45037]|uniref:hypothetical protein n=1 Tax=Bacillus sp. FJAT-45037 TaxID=2011007 RepID=UPI000C248EB7|nr:hypothetical protein [Bacillus sp. FJAT-45037]
MQRLLNQKLFYLFLSAIAMLVVLSACGSNDQDEPTGEVSLVNEENETVTLSNKDRATILFHFTEVG